MEDLDLWTGASFTIVVGENEDRLTVPQGVLEKIPFFEAALSTGNYIEARERTFRLPEDDARAITSIFRYVCSHYVRPISDQLQGDKGETKELEIILQYVADYVLADKWNMECLENRIFDSFREYHSTRPARFEAMAMLRSAQLEDSLLHKFFVQTLVWYIKSNKILPSGPFDSSFRNQLAILPKVDILTILETTRQDFRDPSTGSRFSPLTHEHVTTPKCSVDDGITESGDDDSDCVLAPEDLVEFDCDDWLAQWLGHV